MKKWTGALAVLFMGCFPLFAAEDTPFAAEDFANQSMIMVQNDRDSKRCQAVRILPNWYMTAAHCVRPYCNKECTVTFTLLQGPLQALADVSHTSLHPMVFTPRQYHIGEAKNIRYDVALIHFVPQEQDYFFYDARNKKVLDEQSFLKMLQLSQYSDQRSQWQTLASSRPKLLVTPDTYTRHVQYPLAVPDLRADGIFFHDSKLPDFYYFKELRHYMGSNFGVERGMSGSAVVLPGGAVIGVVSASLNSQSRLVFYDEKDQPVRSVPYSADYFLFTPLSQTNMNFIRATISSAHEPGPKPYFVYISGDEAEKSDATVQSAFPGVLSAQDVLTSQETK